jgi:hypothetical protein
MRCVDLHRFHRDKGKSQDVLAEFILMVVSARETLSSPIFIRTI